jgi:hypothetical protein
VSTPSSDFASFLDFAFAGIRRRIDDLERAHTAELAKAHEATKVVRDHLKAADAENDMLRDTVNDYASKLAIRDSEITRLEVALDDAVARAKWGEVQS